MEITKFLIDIHDKVGQKEFTIYDIHELADTKTTVANIGILKSTGMLDELSSGWVLTESALELVQHELKS